VKHFVIAAFMALMAAGPSLAQDTRPPTEAPRVVTAEKEALVRKFFEVGRVARTTEDAMRAMIPLALEEAVQKNPSLTAEHRNALVAAMHESVGPTAAKILDRFVPIYAQAFTTEDLKTIIDFYQTPAAQTLLDKQPQLMASTTDITRELIPEFQVDVLTRFCRKVDCFKAIPDWDPEASAS
jgi:hypothetical protein